MSKYINADKLIEYFRDAVINETDDAIATIRDYLAMPSADVVEIVRCKDCKYRSKLTSEDSYGIEDWVCNHDCGCAQCDDDDFCRYGERKDEK